MKPELGHKAMRKPAHSVRIPNFKSTEARHDSAEKVSVVHMKGTNLGIALQSLLFESLPAPAAKCCEPTSGTTGSVYILPRPNRI